MIKVSSSGPIAFAGLSQEVARRLREQILSGQLGDGARIVERDVAQDMGLSRGPIRDALRQLEHEGLITWLPRRGARVASITRDDAEEFFALRAAVEPVAAEFFLKRKAPDMFVPFDDCLERLQRAADAEDWPEATRVHMEFHSLVYTLSGRRRLERVWESLSVPVFQTFKLHRPLVDTIGDLPRMHAVILDAMKQGPLATAKKVVRQHALEYEDDVLRALSAPVTLHDPAPADESPDRVKAVAAQR
ncbi:MAG: GntR family transcriptional regulator [Candidatus Dormibacteria bacterium]